MLTLKEKNKLLVAERKVIRKLLVPVQPRVVGGEFALIPKCKSSWLYQTSSAKLKRTDFAASWFKNGRTGEGRNVERVYLGALLDEDR